MDARLQLINILREAKSLLALAGNDFAWTSWGSAPVALEVLDRHIAAIQNQQLPPRIDLAVLFAPTGPIQEVSFSGWADKFLELSTRFDAALERVYALNDSTKTE